MTINDNTNNTTNSLSNTYSHTTNNRLFFTQLQTPNIPQQNAFNFLRLICCLIVVYEHTIGLADLSYINLNLRDIAVKIFFILSGFWVTKSLISSPNLKTYFLKRIKKIFPPYLAVIIFFAIFLCHFSNLSAREYFTSTHFIKYLIANFSTLNFICPSLPEVFGGLAVNGSLWTIKVELGFYIVLPLLLLFIKTLNKRLKGGCNLILVFVYLFSLLWVYTMPILCKRFELPQQIVRQFPCYLAYFTGGMFFFFNWNFMTQHSLKFFIPSLIILILFCIFRFPFSEIILPFALSSVVMFLGTHLKIFNSIAAKNDYSYCMYLIHCPLIMIFKELNFFVEKPFIAIICVFAVTFTLAYLIEEIRQHIKVPHQQK